MKNIYKITYIIVQGSYEYYDEIADGFTKELTVEECIETIIEYFYGGQYDEEETQKDKEKAIAEYNQDGYLLLPGGDRAIKHIRCRPDRLTMLEETIAQ